MQAIDTTNTNATTATNSSSEKKSVLPTPPTSPIDAQQPAKNSRKRAYSISFLNNEPATATKKQKFDLNCLKSFLNQKGSPNTCDEQFKRSLLSWACIGRSTEAIKNLLGLVHLDINMKTGPNKSTALHEACIIGFTEGIELLLQHPDIDINAVDNQGQTAVHCATQANQTECLRILLSAGARIDLVFQGRLAIHTAISYGFQQCVALLLSKSKRHDNNPTQTDMLWFPNSLDNRSSIESAIVTGFTGTLQLLLDQDSVTKDPPHQRTPGLVSLAVVWNRIECLQLLIKRGCIIDNDSLLNAVQQRKIDMVRELAAAGANPCLPNGQNPSFLYAANHGFLDMIPLVLTLDTSKDCIQQALLLASSMGLREPTTKAVVYTLKSLAAKKLATSPTL
ncbi:ankyrin repeat-containing domain protein [Mucor lusitanicus]|uniref:Ankyrin repeat-containing domain protein n=1 Tax=Mucor circinelloides f. lusitanicus TaxID=29924 RepID=A0A8H4F648_MUCCL|nr:ankyrin repeat-containing domain protein [Mucor lusitanicus]